jgi:preprotein translocase subunit SecB
MADEKKAGAERRLAILKIYAKDFSFESPRSPGVFRTEDWKPNINLNLRSSHVALEEGLHEIVLTVTVEAKEKDTDKTLFLVELHQGGLFEIVGFVKEELSALIGSFCPNILFPYVRESVAEIVRKGGFPEFVLQPINFDALYLQQLQLQKNQIGKTAAENH